MNEDWSWWKHGVIYHIYPRSFLDSNDDGIGDIPGIIRKIDYLSDLGVSAIWLSPINRSPMYDFGYDISDYRGIDPVFGSMNDFDTLLFEAHRRGLKVIIDLVLNHTSYLHQWFLAARSSRKNKKRDWYIWRDGNEKKPPNNWISILGGSAWKWDDLTRQYYLHSFLEEQPDLNWRNNEMKEAMFKEVRYWLDRGVDGFRLDVLNYIIKDKNFRSNPTRFGFKILQKHLYNRDRPEIHDLIKEFRTIIDEYNERIAVGEIATFPPGDPELSSHFLGNGMDELHLAFDFSLLYRWWNARLFYRSIKRWLKSVPMDGWPCHVLSNHDQPRSISRYSTGKNDMSRAKVAATLLLTLKGTPFIYYGEEIGMRNGKLSRNEIKDPLGKRYWPLFHGRDAARTPMQWSAEENAGFTSGNPWLPVNSDYRTVNVKSQREDWYSLLNHYATLIALRKEKKALHRGEWRAVLKGHQGILGYYRRHQEEKIFIVLNFTDMERRISRQDRGQWKVLHSTHKSVNTHFIDLTFTLSPNEATVIEKIGEL